MFADGRGIERAAFEIENPLFAGDVGRFLLSHVDHEGLAIDAKGIEGHLVVAFSGGGIVWVEFAHRMERYFLPEARKVEDAEWASGARTDGRDNFGHRVRRGGVSESAIRA